MCEIVTASLAALGATSAATVGGVAIPASVASLVGAAGGAGAAGGILSTGLTIGKVLSTAGLAASVGGQLMQASAAARTAGLQAELLQAQDREAGALASVEDQRVRERFRQAMARQRVELAARGIDASSPAAVMLGETAAREMTFDSQAVRSRARADRVERSATRQNLDASRRLSMLTGRVGAATSLLRGAEETWPGLLS